MSAQSVEMKSVRANTARGVAALLGLVAIAFGGGILWGPGGFMLSLGIVVFVSTTVDEVAERVTGTKRVP